MYEQFLYKPTELEIKQIKEQLEINKRLRNIYILKVLLLTFGVIAILFYPLWLSMNQLINRRFIFVIPSILLVLSLSFTYWAMITFVNMLRKDFKSQDDIYCLCTTMIDSKISTKENFKRVKKYYANMKLDNEDILKGIEIDEKYYQHEGSRFILVFNSVPNMYIPKIECIIPKKPDFSLKVDPVEYTEEYKQAMEIVKPILDKEFPKDKMHLGICYRIWDRQTELLYQQGVEWKSPAVMNPFVHFD